VTRHGPNHACAAATLLQRSADGAPDLVNDAPALGVSDHCTPTKWPIMHRHRNEAGCWSCRSDCQAASCISRNPKSP
jgi:hypothetical protein